MSEQIDQALSANTMLACIEIESETFPPGLDEDVIRRLSAMKDEPEDDEWRLQAYRKWLEMEEPDWAHVDYPKVDYQSISYYSAPKSMKDKPKSPDEVDPELRTYEKLGIPLHEQEMLVGVAVDAVSTRFLWSPPSARNWKKPALFSARFRKQLKNTLSWLKSI